MGSIIRLLKPFSASQLQCTIKFSYAALPITQQLALGKPGCSEVAQHLCHYSYSSSSRAAPGYAHLCAGNSPDN